jgi:beta-lactamase class A
MITRRDFAIGAAATLATGASKAAEAWVDELSREVAAIEAELKARLGVAVLDTASGQRMGYRGREWFPMCSTFKLLACAAVLRRVDLGQEDLKRPIAFQKKDLVPHSPVTKAYAGKSMTLGALCEATMTLSDNTAANQILLSLGGPHAVTLLARSLGDNQTRLDRWEPGLNEAKPGDPRDTTSPDAMVDNLCALLVEESLSARSRDQLAAWLVANKTGDAKIRAGFPDDWRVGDKTGSGHHGTMNDVAIIWPPRRGPLILSIYITETKASVDDRNHAMASVAGAAKRTLRL